MRVLLCNIHCPPFICFCKPSAAHLYTPPGPLKLENTPHVPSTLASVTDNNTTSHQLSAAAAGEATEVKEASSESDGNQQQPQQQQQTESPLKSCIRKPSTEPKEVEKKKVQWMDNMGKELVAIKEFESSDAGDTYNEHENRRCVCIIL